MTETAADFLPVPARRAPLSYALATRLAAILPANAAAALARAAGRLHYHLATDKREAYLGNLSQAIVFTSDNPPWRAFQNQALNVLELLRAVSEPSRVGERARVAGVEHIERSLSRGRGLILTTLHVGNWELSGLLLSSLGYPLTTVAGEQLRSGWSEELKRFKERRGIRTVSPSDHTRALHRDLAANRVLVLHLDGDLYSGGIEATLLGHQVRVPRGPAALARVMHAPVAFAFCRRLRGRDLEVVIETPMTPPNNRQQERQLTHALVARMEKCIVGAPDQWCIFRKL